MKWGLPSQERCEKELCKTEPAIGRAGLLTLWSSLTLPFSLSLSHLYICASNAVPEENAWEKPSFQSVTCWDHPTPPPQAQVVNEVSASLILPTSLRTAVFLKGGALARHREGDTVGWRMPQMGVNVCVCVPVWIHM